MAKAATNSHPPSLKPRGLSYGRTCQPEGESGELSAFKRTPYVPSKQRWPHILESSSLEPCLFCTLLLFRLELLSAVVLLRLTSRYESRTASLPPLCAPSNRTSVSNDDADEKHAEDRLIWPRL